MCQFFSFLGKIQQYIIDSDQLKLIPKSAEKSSGMRATKSEQRLTVTWLSGNRASPAMTADCVCGIAHWSAELGKGWQTHPPPIQPHDTPFSKA